MGEAINTNSRVGVWNCVLCNDDAFELGNRIWGVMVIINHSDLTNTNTLLLNSHNSSPISSRNSSLDSRDLDIRIG